MICVCVKSLSRVRLSETLWTVARQAPLSMGFSMDRAGDLPIIIFSFHDTERVMGMGDCAGGRERSQREGPVVAEGGGV